MQERRNPLYSFMSERDLVRFFSQFLSKGEIRSTMESVRGSFVAREEDRSDESKLQFLKKCETELVRIMRSRGE